MLPPLQTVGCTPVPSSQTSWLLSPSSRTSKALSNFLDVSRPLSSELVSSCLHLVVQATHCISLATQSISHGLIALASLTVVRNADSLGLP